MTKEQIYEIQNNLIDEIMGDAWVSNGNIEDTKSLIYICGVRETINEIIKLMRDENEVCMPYED